MNVIPPLVTAAACILLVCSSSATAQTSRHVLATGAVSASQGTTRLVGTIGQAAIGSAHNGSSTLGVGFWYTGAAKTSVVAGEPDTRSSALTLAGTPNPFSKSTTLTMSIPVSGEGTLVIYNAVGQPMRTVLHGMLDPGRVTTALDMTGLPSGSYTAVLRVGDDQTSTRLILVD